MQKHVQIFFAGFIYIWTSDFVNHSQLALIGFACGAVVENLPANAGDVEDSDWIPESGRSSGVGNGNPLQYSCLKNHMDRGPWWTAIHSVTESQARLKWLSMHRKNQELL